MTAESATWSGRFIVYCEMLAKAHDKKAEADELYATAIPPEFDEAKAEKHRQDALKLVRSYRGLAADYRRMAEEERRHAGLVGDLRQVVGLPRARPGGES